MSAPLHRCLAVWLTATAVAAGLGLVLVPVALAPAAAFDDLLARTCAVLGTLVVAWLWLVTTAVTVEARRGRSRMPAPRGVRRLLLAACGVAVLAGLAAPAGAAPRGDTPRTAVAVVADALSGLPLPDRPHGPERSRPAPQDAHVTVRAGDSLWTLAEEHLGNGERWPEIYALNRAVVGGDPDVIAPAQRLRLPVKEK